MKKICTYAFVLLLTGCFGSSKKENPEKATEVPNKEVVQTDLSAGDLLQKSKKLYENALYSTAVETFQSLKDAYSPGPYAEFAEIKTADSNFEMRKFDVSATNYEEFIKTHPSSKSVAYAMLRAGRSHELNNKGVGRDMAPLEKAKDFYEKLIEQYPDSVYTYAARQYFQSIAQKIAEHDEFVRDFYRKRDKEDAALARQKHFDKSIKPILQKANSQSKSANAAENKPARKAAKAEMPEVLEIQRTSSVSVKRPAPAPEVKIKTDEELRSATYKIQAVQCRGKNGDKLIIYLNKEFNNLKFIENNAQIESKDGLIEFTLPDTQGRELSVNCFGEGDLKLDKYGKISLRIDAPASLISLNNPPRLLLSFE